MTPHPHTKPTRHPRLDTAAALLGSLILTAQAIAAWFADLTEWERVWRVTQTVIVAACALVVIALLASCRPDSDPPGPIPGGTVSAVHTTSVKVVQP
jgi:hypothetical protein